MPIFAYSCLYLWEKGHLQKYSYLWTTHQSVWREKGQSWLGRFRQLLASGISCRRTKNPSCPHFSCPTQGPAGPRTPLLATLLETVTKVEQKSELPAAFLLFHAFYSPQINIQTDIFIWNVELYIFQIFILSAYD